MEYYSDTEFYYRRKPHHCRKRGIHRIPKLEFDCEEFDEIIDANKIKKLRSPIKEVEAFYQQMALIMFMSMYVMTITVASFYF